MMEAAERKPIHLSPVPTSLALEVTPFHQTLNQVNTNLFGSGNLTETQLAKSIPVVGI